MRTLAPQYIPVRRRDFMAMSSWRSETSPPPESGPVNGNGSFASHPTGKADRDHESKGGSASPNPGPSPVFFVRVALAAAGPTLSEVRAVAQGCRFESSDTFSVRSPASIHVSSSIAATTGSSTCNGGGRNGGVSNTSGLLAVSPEMGGRSGPAESPSMSPSLYTPESAPAPPLDDGALPPMQLPQSLSASALGSCPLFVLRYHRSDHAEECLRVLQAAFPNAAMEIAHGANEAQSPSLVIKGVPFSFRPEMLAEYLSGLKLPPSYLRLQRGDRGMFKCVIFVRFPSVASADIAKMELDRLEIGARPLKVEYKKKGRRADESVLSEEETIQHQIDSLVRETRVSKEYEGFSVKRDVITREELLHLKTLCQSYDLLLELVGDKITVRRPEEGKGRVDPNSGIGNNKRSPALRPQSYPSTPPWHPATPGSLAPMDSAAASGSGGGVSTPTSGEAGAGGGTSTTGLNFRGIRHWRETRQANGPAGGLGIIRPLGPGDAAPFAAGRGRPLR